MSLLLLLQSAGGAPTTNANAELASASGSAAASSATIAANAGLAEASGSALQASVTTSAAVNADAGLATAIGMIYGVTATLGVNAGLAEGAGSAAAATANLGAQAGLAEGAGSALAATTTLVSQPTAGLAEATGTAFDAGVTTSSAKSVDADLTTAAGSALEASILRPTWVSPADGSNMATTPVLVFTIPEVGAAAHFWMELDTAATFDTGDLQVIRSDLAQTGWQFWDDAQWQDVPVGGVAVDYAGNEARYTVQTPLAAGTWYRRVRAGV